MSTSSASELVDAITATTIPYRLYSEQGIFEREMSRIFHGPSWNFVGFEAEMPEVGDFKTSFVGNRSVIICRDRDNAINAFVNRCAHRGVRVCREQRGNRKRFICPYHNWNYDLKGKVVAVPFEKGVKGQGGMPESFDKEEHALPSLQVAVHQGVIFVSFDPDAPSFEEYMGEANLHYFNRVFAGREVRILGYARQLIPANWKLMFENIKDPYHATLLHVFLVTFGLFRADNESMVKMDPDGKHALLISERGRATKSQDDVKDMKNLLKDFKLNDPALLDPVKEFSDRATVVMQTVWPNLIVQQQSNTLAMRQIIPLAPDKFELRWIFFGYASDDEAMTVRRLRQANLMSAAGLVSGDDSEVMKLAQEGASQYRHDKGLALLGGEGVDDEDHMVTEAAIRAFYRFYKQVMA